MRKLQLYTTVAEQVSEITCNMCGKKINIIEEEVEDWQLDSFHEFNIFFGYGSQRDGEYWNFDLCDSCLKKLVKTFNIPVNIDKNPF